MSRELLVNVIEDDAHADALLRSRLAGNILKRLNSSQRQAVATLLDPNFERGFLAVQGPPGTGKSTGKLPLWK